MARQQSDKMEVWEHLKSAVTLLNGSVMDLPASRQVEAVTPLKLLCGGLCGGVLVESPAHRGTP